MLVCFSPFIFLFGKMKNIESGTMWCHQQQQQPGAKCVHATVMCDKIINLNVILRIYVYIIYHEYL